jgi:hypothetical protein
MLAGQVVEPDHVDGGGPTDYAGWAHAGCNHSAGAAYGNRLRAAAYRAARGVPAPVNGSGAFAAQVLVDDHSCGDAGCHADPARCGCGRHSRGW